MLSLCKCLLDKLSRRANPCGQERDRAICRRMSCCRSVMTTLAAFPGMADSARSVNLGDPERMTKLAS